MKQYGFYVDSSRCSGCKTCQVSCKDNKDLDVGPKLPASMNMAAEAG